MEFIAHVRVGVGVDEKQMRDGPDTSWRQLTGDWGSKNDTQRLDGQVLVYYGWYGLLWFKSMFV